MRELVVTVQRFCWSLGIEREQFYPHIYKLLIHAEWAKNVAPNIFKSKISKRIYILLAVPIPKSLLRV